MKIHILVVLAIIIAGAAPTYARDPLVDACRVWVDTTSGRKLDKPDYEIGHDSGFCLGAIRLGFLWAHKVNPCIPGAVEDYTDAIRAFNAYMSITPGAEYLSPTDSIKDALEWWYCRK
jgi:hypothetical protein